MKPSAGRWWISAPSIRWPDEVVLQMVGGATHRARRWAVGTQGRAGICRPEIITAETTEEMVEAARLLRAPGLPAAMVALRGQRFFELETLRTAVEEPEAAFYKLEAMLRDH